MFQQINLGRVSPAVAAAMVAWDQKARAFDAFEGPDGVMNEMCDRLDLAIRAIGSMPCANLEDLAAKIYVLSLLRAGQTTAGPLPEDVSFHEESFIEAQAALWRGIVADLPRVSALAAAMWNGDRPEAQAAPPSRNLWDQRYAAWRAAVALKKADAEFGRLATVSADTQAARHRLSEAAKSCDPGELSKRQASLRAAIADENAADEQHYFEWGVPADEAAVALTLTPAPDLDAALAKIEVIRQHELDNDRRIPGDILQLIQADFRRLGYLHAGSAEPAKVEQQ